MTTSTKKKSSPPAYEFMNPMSDTACVILGGGRGTRLFPLTQHRSKPAISFGGRYRIIDFALSNAINSGCKQIFIITQFLSSSIHRHIIQCYQLPSYGSERLDLLCAEQKPSNHTWFQGTADAIRQNLNYLLETPAEYYLILSGDQIYQLDFRKVVQFAKENGADLTVCSLPVSAADAKRMGIIAAGPNQLITDFIEKPEDPHRLAPFARDKSKTPYLGSMGIYLFKREALMGILEKDSREDFGKHLIPTCIQHHKCATYIHEGYWEDIGTIESYYRANIQFAQSSHPLRMYQDSMPIYGAHLHLPGAKLDNCEIEESIVCEGVHIESARLNQSILGPRTMVKNGTSIIGSYLLGNDFYERPAVTHNDLPRSLSIGRNCMIKNAILDKNVSLGNSVTLTNKNNLQYYDGEGIGVYIREGITVVTKGTHLPDGFEL